MFDFGDAIEGQIQLSEVDQFLELLNLLDAVTAQIKHFKPFQFIQVFYELSINEGNTHRLWENEK